MNTTYELYLWNGILLMFEIKQINIVCKTIDNPVNI